MKITIELGERQIDIETADDKSMQPVGGRIPEGKEKVDSATAMFRQSMAGIAEFASSVRDLFAASGAAEAEIKFGVKVGAKGNVFVAEASTEATVEVKLKFVQDSGRS